MGIRTVRDGRHKTVDNVRYRPRHHGPVRVLLKSLCLTSGEQTEIFFTKTIFLLWWAVRYGAVPYRTVQLPYGTVQPPTHSVTVGLALV